MKDESGRVLLGDEIVSDWRGRSKRGMARVRAYYDVHPARNSELTLDPATKNKWGDPMPKIDHRFDDDTQARYPATKQHIPEIFARLWRADEGNVAATSEGDYLDHPAGGCRMGTDPAASVCDSFGRTHDHENLFVVGAPTLAHCGLHQRHADLRGAHPAFRRRNRPRLQGVTPAAQR